MSAATAAPVPLASQGGAREQAGASLGGALPAGDAPVLKPQPRVQADTAPHIYSVSASPPVVHNGETVSWDVRTSDNVSAVSAQVTGFSIALPQLGPGHFSVSFTVPAAAPPFLHGNYVVNVVARTSGGASASRTISLSFR